MCAPDSSVCVYCWYASSRRGPKRRGGGARTCTRARVCASHTPQKHGWLAMRARALRAPAPAHKRPHERAARRPPTVRSTPAGHSHSPHLCLQLNRSRRHAVLLVQARDKRRRRAVSVALHQRGAEAPEARGEPSFRLWCRMCVCACVCVCVCVETMDDARGVCQRDTCTQAHTTHTHVAPAAAVAPWSSACAPPLAPPPRRAAAAAAPPRPPRPHSRPPHLPRAGPVGVGAGRTPFVRARVCVCVCQRACARRRAPERHSHVAYRRTLARHARAHTQLTS
jgi:hypothetical protein